MSDPEFHTVDPESLKNIPIEAILSPHSPALETADYTVPVPTEDQSLPHCFYIGRGHSIVDDKLVNPDTSLKSQYRGRLGGC